MVITALAVLSLIVLQSPATKSHAQSSDGPRLRAEIVKQVGGATKAVENNGKYVFASHGPRILVFDADQTLESDPLSWTEPLPGVVEVIHYARGHLFVGVSHQSEGLRVGGLAVVNVSDPRRPQLVDYHETGVLYQEITSLGNRLWASGAITIPTGFVGYSYRTGVGTWNIEDSEHASRLHWNGYLDARRTVNQYSIPERISLGIHGDHLIVASGGGASDAESIDVDVYEVNSNDFDKLDSSVRLSGSLDALFVDGFGIHIVGRGHPDGLGKHWLLDLTEEGHLTRMGASRISINPLLDCYRPFRVAPGPSMGQWWVLNPCKEELALYNFSANDEVEMLHEMPLPRVNDLTSDGLRMWVSGGNSSWIRHFAFDSNAFLVAQISQRNLLGPVVQISKHDENIILGLSTGSFASISALNVDAGLEFGSGPELGEIQDLAFDVSGRLAALVSNNFMLINPSSLTLEAALPIGSGVRQLLSTSRGFIVNARDGGVQAINIADTGPELSASDSSITVEHIALDGERLLVLGNDKGDGLGRLKALSLDDLSSLPTEDWMTAVGQTVPDLGHFPQYALFHSGVSDFTLVGHTGRPDGPEKTIVMGFDKVPPLQEAGVSIISHDIGQFPNSIVPVGERLLLAAKDGLIGIEHPANEAPAVSLVWRAAGSIRDMQLLGVDSKGVADVLIADGEAGVYQLRISDSDTSDLQGPPTALPAPTSTPSPAPTRSSPVSLSNPVYLPLVSRRMEIWKHAEGPNAELRYLEMRGGPTGAMAAEGDLLLRDEAGQIVAYLWTEEDGLVEAGRAPVSGEHARDILIHDKRAYVAAGDHGIEVFSLEQPLDLTPIQTIEAGIPVSSIAHSDGTLYFSAKDQILTYDLSSAGGSTSAKPFSRVPGLAEPIYLELRTHSQYLIAFSHQQKAEIARIYDLGSPADGGGSPLFAEPAEDDPLYIQDIVFLEPENRVLILQGEQALVYDSSDMMDLRSLGSVRLDWRGGDPGARASLKEDGIYFVSFASRQGEIGVSKFLREEFLIDEGSQSRVQPVISHTHENARSLVLSDSAWMGDKLAVQYGLYEHEQFGPLPSDLFVHDFSSQGTGDLIFTAPGSTNPAKVLASDRFVFHQTIHADTEAGSTQISIEYADSGDPGSSLGGPINLTLPGNQSLAHLDDLHFYILEDDPEGGLNHLHAYSLQALPEIRLLQSIQLDGNGTYEFASHADKLYIIRIPFRGDDADSGGLLVWEATQEGMLQLMSSAEDISVLNYGREFTRLWASEARVFVLQGDRQIGVYDVSDTSRISKVGAIEACLANAFSEEGTEHFCLDGFNIELRIVDIDNVSSPSVLADLSVPLDTFDKLDENGFVRQMVLDHSLLYLIGDGMVVVEVARLDRPKVLATVPGPKFAKQSVGWIFNSVGHIGDRVYAAMYDRALDLYLGLAILEWSSSESDR